MTTASDMSALKTRLKATWESGDYGVFATYLEKGALEFFDRVNIPSGVRLLDVGCGAGQLTLPAARTGIQVDQGDAEDLKTTRHMYPFEYPLDPAKVVDFFIEYYGPTNRAYASLNDARTRALHDDLTALWTRNNSATDGTTRVWAEYIEVNGTR